MSEQAPVDLGLSDADYWDNPYKNRVALETQLLDDERSAMLVGAPSKVDFQARETLPLVILRVGPLDELARLRVDLSALVVAVEQASNTTYAAQAIIKDNVRVPAYDGPPLEGMSGEAFTIDLRKRLELPWSRGSYLVWLIMREHITPSVRVELAKGGYQDPAVEAYLAQTASVREPADIWPMPLGKDDGRSVPSYRAHESSPPIPEQRGINLVAPRVLDRSEHMRAIVRGSFRLASLPRHVGAGPLDGPPATATVTISLVLTGSDVAAPFVFALQVPSYEGVHGSAEQPEITGYFNVDLQRLANLAAMDQTYFIYAFSGDIAIGPVPMALVTRYQAQVRP